MEISQFLVVSSILFLMGCNGKEKINPLHTKDHLPTAWNFNFFTPKALPAVVTFAVVQDAGGKVYEFNTLDKTPGLPNVIGSWNDKDRVSGGHWNHVELPPKHIIFCWDSIIDKKVYETHLTFPAAVVEKMRSPSGKSDPYNNTYDTVQIGLAPEGKITVWLQGIGYEPNPRVTPSVLYTLSGNKLGICQGITRFSSGYEYGEDTKEFIKGKKYPYGSW